MNLYEYFRQSKRSSSDKPAVIVPDAENISYEAVETATKRIAAWFHKQGLEVGDRVGIVLPDCPEYIPIVLGIWRLGCVATPVNTRFEREERAYVLNDVQPGGLVTAGNAGDELIADVDALRSDAYLTVDPHEWFADTDLPAAGTAPPARTRLDDEIAIIMHTSGTTGKPKGVIQTHRNISAEIEGGISKFQLTADDTGLVTVPLFHVGGMHETVLMTLFTGGGLVIQSEWDATEWARLVEQTDATWSALIPTMIVDVLGTNAALSHDTSSLRFCLYGGSATPEPIIKQFGAATGVGKMINNYGQTENAGVCVTYSVDDDRRPGAMGTPVPAVEARVVGIQTIEDVPPGEEGELLLRGDSITPGYWERPERNEELFTDGWLHTEDVVRRDEDGYFYYVDRIDDMILSGGEKISPSEVENVLQDHPDVSSVAVFGTPHKRYGEAVTAALIPVDGAEIDTKIVETFCENRDGLAGYKKPRRIFVRDEFPQTGSHKIDKVALAEQVSAEFEET